MLDSCRYLQQRGVDVTYLPVQASRQPSLQPLLLSPPLASLASFLAEHQRAEPDAAPQWLRPGRDSACPRPTRPPAQSNGLIDLQQLADSIRPDTALVSVMAVSGTGGGRGGRVGK